MQKLGLCETMLHLVELPPVVLAPGLGIPVRVDHERVLRSESWKPGSARPALLSIAQEILFRIFVLLSLLSKIL